MSVIEYIGLDISTSIIGVSLFNSNKELVDLISINLKKLKCIFTKSYTVREEFTRIKNNFSISENVRISIEEPFQSFSKGFSSAKTLSQLNRFNGIVSFLSADAFCVTPVYINVNSARKTLGIKVDKKSNETVKEQVFSWVKRDLDREFNWPTKIISRGPNKGVVKFDECCYDMSDAYVICKALIINETKNTD